MNARQKMFPAPIDELVKSQKAGLSLIPAEAGILLFQDVLDPGFRRGDAPRGFLRRPPQLVSDYFITSLKR
jgi:hypothetical protein